MVMYMRKFNLFFKRIGDIIGSLLGILLLLPLFLVLSLIIKLTSAGEVFFLQDRIGINGLTFKIIKFRTMVKNAEKLGECIRISDPSDSRITKVGRFLRKTSLDELPQLFNVLTGSMSIVGPRPPVTYHPYNGYDEYPEWAKKRFLMRPGITGLAQIILRNSCGWDERIKYDVKYVDNFNIFLDIKIIFKTFIRIVKPKDMYLKNTDKIV